MEEIINTTDAQDIYNDGGIITSDYTIVNDYVEYNPDSPLSDWTYTTGITGINDGASIELLHDDTQANITLNDDLWFYTNDGRKVSLEQIIKTMDAVKLLGDIFKYVQFKPAISKSIKNFMDIVNNLPDIIEPIEDEDQEHIEDDLFKI